MKVHGFELDAGSFQLGMINCFVEMVASGVKRLAVSPPLPPRDYERIREASDAMVEAFQVHQYLEKSLLITDLQSEEFTRGKWSILFYMEEETLRAYLALKERKRALEAEGEYTSEARREISGEFMRLLSYPEEVIEARIAAGGDDDPFLLVQS